MAKFCGKCGARLDDQTGKCPNCDKQINRESLTADHSIDTTTNQSLSKKALKTAKKAKKRAAKEAKKKKHVFLRIVGMLIILALLVSSVSCALVYYNIVKIPVINSIFNSIGIDNVDFAQDSYKVSPPDADEYYSNNSTIISQTDANSSAYVLTEAEAYEIFTKRGFTQYPITTSYSMNGEYFDATEITDTSSSKHPMYQTYYVTSNREIWTVSLINGETVANPATYNVNSSLNLQVLISESKTITSYDSTKNKFYETIPNETTLNVIVVDHIDSATLEKLTTEEIDKHV